MNCDKEVSTIGYFPKKVETITALIANSSSPTSAEWSEHNGRAQERNSTQSMEPGQNVGSRTCQNDHQS